jgi:hypothetical protein
MQTTTETKQAIRHDLYTTVHKGLRACMSDVLTTIGRVDESDADEVADAIAQTRLLMEICRSHLFTENQFVHTAMEARQRGSACVTAGQHVEQEKIFERIDSSILAVERTSGTAREASLLSLYRTLALFVAENFTHMHAEEVDNNATLWSLYSDSELHQIHDDILNSIEPAKKVAFLRWMLPYVTPSERSQILAGIQQAVPQPVFEQILSIIRPHLREKDRGKFGQSLHFN